MDRLRVEVDRNLCGSWPSHVSSAVTLLVVSPSSQSRAAKGKGWRRSQWSCSQHQPQSLALRSQTLATTFSVPWQAVKHLVTSSCHPSACLQLWASCPWVKTPTPPLLNPLTAHTLSSSEPPNHQCPKETSEKGANVPGNWFMFLIYVNAHVRTHCLYSRVTLAGGWSHMVIFIDHWSVHWMRSPSDEHTSVFRTFIILELCLSQNENHSWRPVKASSAHFPIYHAGASEGSQRQLFRALRYHTLQDPQLHSTLKTMLASVTATGKGLSTAARLYLARSEFRLNLQDHMQTF